MKSKLLQLFFSGLTLAIVPNILIPFERIQSKLTFISAKAMSFEPPEVTGWIYSEMYYFLALYAILFGFVSSVVFLSRKLSVFPNLRDGYIYYSSLTLSVLLYHSKEPFFRREKVIFFILIIIIINILYFNFRSRLTEILLYLKEMINKKFFGMVFFLISISTLQRLIALYLDNNDLFAGDDPNTFYYQAVSFYESGVIKPNSGFSPGMSFYLLGMFKFFGIGQFFPKLIMIFLGSLGLLSLALFINSFFKSKAVSIVALLFYITSSHYVSFSNQFWNENLFHPAFSVFLYLTWKIFEEKKKSINQSINQSINLSIYLSIVPVIMLSLTLLRSWFPLPGLIWILFLFYTAYSNKLHFLKKTAIVSAGIIFLGLGLLYSDHYSSQKGVATSNSPINLLIGNNPYSQGTYTRHWVTFVRDYKINLEDKNYISQVININIDNPFIIVRNLKNKAFLWFLGAGGPRPISPYYQHPLLILQYFYRFTVFLLFLFGASFLFSHRKGKILVLLYFSVFMIHMIYFADYRFTLTAMPLQAIFVSFGVMRIMKRLSAWQSIFFQESRTE